MQTSPVIGHHSHTYRVHSGWGIPPGSSFPVRDCHEMILAGNGLLYLLTNDTRNNILIYRPDGSLQGAWGHSYPGAHGLTRHDENGTDFLYITDCERHEVIKTSLEGRVMMVLGYPAATGCYPDAASYKPTEVAIAPNGDIYVADGYGLQFIIQYDHQGNYIRHWGGKDVFDCAHGIAIDSRQDPPTLLITSRNANRWRRFSMDGKHIGDIHLPGSYVCRPVLHGNDLYGAVFRSGRGDNPNSGYITILDVHDRVISTPGGSEPVYSGGRLMPQHQVGIVFMHPHDVCVDDGGDLYIPQWNAGHTYPIKLERIR